MRAHLLCNDWRELNRKPVSLFGQVKYDFVINHMQAFEWCSDDHENNGVFDNQHFLLQITPCCTHGVTYTRIHTYIRIYAYIPYVISRYIRFGTSLSTRHQEDSRPVGCSQMTWDRAQEKALASKGISKEFKEWIAIANDRPKWRQQTHSKPKPPDGRCT